MLLRFIFFYRNESVKTLNCKNPGALSKAVKLACPDIRPGKKIDLNVDWECDLGNAMISIGEYPDTASI
jgi:hypothetical protein